MEFTRNDYRILSKLYENACFSRLCSFKIQRIAEETQLSVPKIRQSLKMFVSLELIDKGAKDEKADTFFLTKKGIELAEENMKVDKELLKKINKMKNDGRM